MAKTNNVVVKGKSLTMKEKGALDKVTSLGKVSANELVSADMNIYSARATLARLEKTHGLLKSSKKLEGDKIVTMYEVV